MNPLNPPALRNLVDEDLPNPNNPNQVGVLGTFQHALCTTDYAHFDMDPGNGEGLDLLVLGERC
jgi:hypothetical protein